MSSSDVERQNILAERKSSEQPQTNVEFETDPLRRLGFNPMGGGSGFTGSEDTTETSVSPTEETQAPSRGWGAVDAMLASPEVQKRMEERRAAEAEALRKRNEDGASWVNSQYDPDRNKGGYTRYDYTQRGSGLHLSRTFADGASTFDVYNALQKGQPGYTHAQNARNNLTQMGVTVDTATDEQKFDALDLAFRGAQWKNRRPKRGFGIKEALGLALQVGSFFVPGGPVVAGAMGATGAGLQGGGPGGIALGAFAPWAGGKIFTALQYNFGITANTIGAIQKAGTGLLATGIAAEVIDRYTEEQKGVSRATGLG